MDHTLAQDDNVRSKIKIEWAKWRKCKGFYPDMIAWWERQVKPHLQRLVRREEFESNKQHNIMENHLYECLYDIMRRSVRDTDKYYDIQRYIAYADDVTIFVINPTDFHTIRQAIRRYEQATGAQLNPHKSKALDIGTWTEPASTLGIPLHERVKILGVSFGHTNALNTQGSWPRVINTIRAQAKQSYTRNLNLAQRFHYVKLHLFAKLWFLAQIIQLTRQHAQQITAIATWFIWRGSIFKVPVITLQRPKWEGGWDLPHIETKC
jgi:hypothetical protein